jgi:hypothetical protein
MHVKLLYKILQRNTQREGGAQNLATLISIRERTRRRTTPGSIKPLLGRTSLHYRFLPAQIEVFRRIILVVKINVETKPSIAFNRISHLLVHRIDKKTLPRSKRVSKILSEGGEAVNGGAFFVFIFFLIISYPVYFLEGAERREFECGVGRDEVEMTKMSLLAGSVDCTDLNSLILVEGTHIIFVASL